MPERNVADRLDVTALIDRDNLNKFQLCIVRLYGLVVRFVGADATSIAIAAAAIDAKLGGPMSDFGVIFSAGTVSATGLDTVSA